MYTLLIMTVKADVDEPYGGYHDGWQTIGALIPIICFIVFLVPLIYPGKDAKPSGKFKETFRIGNSSAGNGVVPMEAELAKGTDQ